MQSPEGAEAWHMGVSIQAADAGEENSYLELHRQCLMQDMQCRAYFRLPNMK